MGLVNKVLVVWVAAAACAHMANGQVPDAICTVASSFPTCYSGVPGSCMAQQCPSLPYIEGFAGLPGVLRFCISASGSMVLDSMCNMVAANGLTLYKAAGFFDPQTSGTTWSASGEFFFGQNCPTGFPDCGLFTRMSSGSGSVRGLFKTLVGQDMIPGRMYRLRIEIEATDPSTDAKLEVTVSSGMIGSMMYPNGLLQQTVTFDVLEDDVVVGIFLAPNPQEEALLQFTDVSVNNPATGMYLRRVVIEPL